MESSSDTEQQQHHPRESDNDVGDNDTTTSLTPIDTNQDTENDFNQSLTLDQMTISENSYQTPPSPTTAALASTTEITTSTTTHNAATAAIAASSVATSSLSSSSRFRHNRQSSLPLRLSSSQAHNHHHPHSSPHQNMLRKQAHHNTTRPLVSSSLSAEVASTTPFAASSSVVVDVPPASSSSSCGIVAAPISHSASVGNIGFSAVVGSSSSMMDDGGDDPDGVSSSSCHRPSLGWSLVEINSDVSGSAPCQRSLHTAAVLNGCMYVFGGYDGTSRVNDFHAFSFAERRWSPVLPSSTSGPPPSPRDRHVAVVHGHSFYVFGGFDGTSRVSDFFGFDFSSMTWRRVNPTIGTPPSPRHSHAGVVHGSCMYIFGGYDGSYRSDFHEFHFGNGTWRMVPSTGRPPRARYRATTVVWDRTLLLFGGHDGTRHLADTHTYDFQTKTWSHLATEGPPPLPRDSHVSVVHENSMYVFGGSTGEAMNDLHELKLNAAGGGGAAAAAKWSPVVRGSQFVTPGHRFCHVGVVHGDSIYIFGGYDGSHRLNDFIKFDFEVDDLTCTVPPSTLIADLRSFIDNETMSDVTLLIDEKPIYAHKIMLMRSSYFRAMLMGDMRESQQNTIRLSQVRYEIFLSLLEYLYTDTIDMEVEDAMELFVAADQFCIPRLKAICEKKMLASITVDNAAGIYYAADLHSARSLKQKTLKFILAHFENVSKTNAFEEMARGNVELVFEILRRR